MQIETHGIGYRTFCVKKQAPTVKTSVRYTENSMENKYISVKFNENGTVDVTEKKTGRTYLEQNLFEDTRDDGNLYNYIQREGDVAVTNANTKADISVHEVTPWSVTFKVAVRMEIEADITTYVTLSDRIARVDFRTVVTNRMENHRLRALFASDIKTDSVYAEGQFDVVRRDIVPSDFWKNPCNAQRVQAFATLESDNDTAALMAANRGLCEYEVLRDGRNTLAITLLRAVGEIGDWGVFPTPLGQKKGTWTLEYSLIPYTTDSRARAYREGYTFAYPAAIATGTTKHEGALPNAADYVRFDNEHIRMTALKKAEDRPGVILRLFNTTNESITLNMTLSPIFKEAKLTNLAETQLSDLVITDNTLTLSVPPQL